MEQTVYILGAGASARSGGPVLKRFFRHVFEKHHDDERVRRVEKFLLDFFACSRSTPADEMPTYETVLSFIDLALKDGAALDAVYHERKLIELRDDLLYLIWLSLRSASETVTDELHMKFVSEILGKDDTIISLNYDLLIDNAMLQVYKRIDYGVRFTGTVMSAWNHERQTCSPLLLKLHGSLNWLQCPTCQCIYLYLGPEPTARIFEGAGEYCPSDGTYLTGILIPPTWVKNYSNPHLLQIWMNAEQRLIDADRVVFIGYSLAPADMQVLFSVRKALHNNRKTPLVEVVNPERRDVVHRRYRRLFRNVVYHRRTFGEWLEENCG